MRTNVPGLNPQLLAANEGTSSPTPFPHFNNFVAI
jgi:hypothetical protein